MKSDRSKINRRRFLSNSTLVASGAVASLSAAKFENNDLVIDAHMHFEAYGEYWDGLIDEIIEHYDHAGVDKGIVFTCWTPSRESNNRTHAGCKKYPDRFLPFGHVRTQDADWKDELKRIADWGWKGMKLHQSEIARGAELKEVTADLVQKASDLGIRVMLIHLEDYEIMEELTQEIEEVTWIIPHMGYDREKGQMESFCKLARNRKNVYLDTSGTGAYYKYGQAIEWAGVEKVVFASDGFWYSPLVEKAKLECLQLPTPFRTSKLSDKQLAMILGGNAAKILGI